MATTFPSASREGEIEKEPLGVLRPDQLAIVAEENRLVVPAFQCHLCGVPGSCEPIAHEAVPHVVLRPLLDPCALPGGLVAVA